MPRQARIDYVGALHHVIGRGIERSRVFKEEKDKRAFLERLQKQLAKSSMRCYAWCIMNNHFHILLQSGSTLLAEFMRRLLTSYAVYYNILHKRSGHLFQNRYKSVLCDKDSYLLPLMRYIHLNPVKAKVVDIEGLKSYDWTGHREILAEENKKGRIICLDEILGYFGKRKKEAKKEYCKFVEEGINIDEDYEGGGLVRSAGGMRELLNRPRVEKEQYDERILGDSAFVERVYKLIGCEEQTGIKSKEELMQRICRYYRQGIEEVIARPTKKARAARIVYVYLGYRCLGISLTELGKDLGIKQPAASMALVKGKREIEKIGGEEKILT